MARKQGKSESGSNGTYLELPLLLFRFFGDRPPQRLHELEHHQRLVNLLSPSIVSPLLGMVDRKD